ncbi:predicted protein [Arabidopsis lyrata subsp. lyrata]|uniref:Predicted protein n=1 Tax=Arabidopsis lyrata subsp. lyrata TaxID=81972 RepID=D7KMY3_ARALL|nr:predicted protein [Arabidopsis lyrata subsp. lyrata]
MMVVINYTYGALFFCVKLLGGIKVLHILLLGHKVRSESKAHCQVIVVKDITVAEYYFLVELVSINANVVIRYKRLLKLGGKRSTTFGGNVVKWKWNKGSFVLELQPKSMVAVIRNGQFSNSLPKCATATTTTQRNLKNLCMLFIELVNCYNEGKIGKLEELVLTMFEERFIYGSPLRPPNTHSEVGLYYDLGKFSTEIQSEKMQIFEVILHLLGFDLPISGFSVNLWIGFSLPYFTLFSVTGLSCYRRLHERWHCGIGSFHAVKNGVTVVCSAGNSDPKSGTVSKVAPWIITVGASSMDREQRKASRICKGSLDPEKVKGKILVCLRGDNARVDKGQQAVVAGMELRE